ncbi:TPA: hypothetical protein ACN1IR_005480, partial [Klebsiella pneumoniae]
ASFLAFRETGQNAFQCCFPDRGNQGAEWLAHYNNERTHQGKMCCGRTPMETLLDGKHVWAEKNLDQM